jgi:hypothetical protein
LTSKLLKKSFRSQAAAKLNVLQQLFCITCNRKNRFFCLKISIIHLIFSEQRAVQHLYSKKISFITTSAGIEIASFAK